jgi:hypothetical protein
VASTNSSPPGRMLKQYNCRMERELGGKVSRTSNWRCLDTNFQPARIDFVILLLTSKSGCRRRASLTVQNLVSLLRGPLQRPEQMFSPSRIDHLVEHPSSNLDMYLIFSTEACDLKSMSPSPLESFGWTSLFQTINGILGFPVSDVPGRNLRQAASN